MFGLSTEWASVIVGFTVIVPATVSAVNAIKAKQQASATNRAVNMVAPGERTLIQRVDALEAHARDMYASQQWTARCVHKLVRNVGIEVEEPPQEERRHHQ